MEREDFFRSEGVGVLIEPSDARRSDYGTVRVGLPAFQFIQDEIDYGTKIHHTNQDVYDHCIPEDLIQSAIVMASFVYHAAMREEKLPRKPMHLPRASK